MGNGILKVKHLFTPLEIISDALIAWDENGKIIFVGPRCDAPKLNGEIYDFSDLSAMPGFIDIHVHGGWGVEFGRGNLKDGLHAYSQKAPSSGVTGFLITVSGPSPIEIIDTIRSYVPLLRGEFPGAIPLGFHLEGPFLNPDRHGAFNPDWLHNPTIAEMQGYIDVANGHLRQVSLAPELENAFEVANLLHERGIRVALAHSSADYDLAAKALAGSFTHVTHTFNAQKPFHHRQPGVIGAILTSENVTAELIADTVHVHPAAMEILVRCLGSDRVVLITDAMSGAGMEDGQYHLIGQEVTVKQGKAYLPDGTIAGSVATLDQCVRNMVNKVGVPTLHAVKMASINPAATIGLPNRFGSVEKHRIADIALTDEKLNVKAVFVRGKLLYSSSHSRC